MKPLGIHARIIVVAFVVIASTTLTLGIVGIRISGRFMQERFKDRISFLSRYLALNSEVGVLINDRTGLNSLAHNLLGERDVARVLILDNQDDALVDLSRPSQGLLSVVETAVIFKRARDENIIFDDRLDIYNNPFMKRPPVVEEVIGTVRIYFSTHGIDQLIVLISRKYLWLSLALAGVAVVLFFFISRSIGVELNTLTVAAQQIGRGDFSLRVSPGKLPETRALALAFNAMLDSLDESQKALGRANREMMQQKGLAEMGRFSLMIAHEVKNPLAIIKSSLDVLKTDFNMTSEQTMVAYIEDEIVRLNQLIEAFLQFARPAKPVFREVDLNQMLTDVVERFEMMHHDESMTIDLRHGNGQVVACVDRDLMVRAIGNIIKNACEAAGASGTVTVTASVDRNVDCWRVTIADTGEGIDPAHQQSIFEPFFTTRSTGTGLGLPFATQVVKAHGGFVIAENSPSGGAVFSLEIPVGSAQPRSVMPAPGVPAAGSPPDGLTAQKGDE